MILGRIKLLVIGVWSITCKLYEEWNEEANARREDVLNKTSWGKGGQLVLVPVTFEIPDSCQARCIFVVIPSDLCRATPLYTYCDCDTEEYV